MSITATASPSAAASGTGSQLEVIKNGFGANITNMSFADGVDESSFQFLKQAVKDASGHGSSQGIF